MSHELEIVNGQARMFYYGDTPWHGMGTSVSHLLTADEALTESGLRWLVEKVPAFDRLPDGSFVEIPDSYNIRRDEDNKVLGRVGGDYTPIQNHEAFSFFDALVDSGEAKYETAGSLFGGKKIWLTAKLPDFNVCGENFNGYLLLSTTHDGSRALTAATTFIRAVCNNTVTMGFGSAKTKWSLHHKTTIEGKVQEARDTLQMAHKAEDAFDQEVQKMMAIQVEKDQFQEIIEADGFLPAQKRQKEKNVEKLMSIFENEPTVNETDAKGTGWGAFNTLTFWLDHGLEVRSPEARMVKLTDGLGSSLRNKMRDRVLALA